MRSIKFLLLPVLAIALFACSKENAVAPKEESINSTSNHPTSNQTQMRALTPDAAKEILKSYNIELASNPSSYSIPSVIIDGITFAPGSAEIYRANGTNVIFLMYDNPSNSSISYIVKGTYERNVFTEEKRLKQTFNLSSSGNGSITEENITDNISFTMFYVNGITVGGTVPPANTQFGLCQREKGESFKNCFKRESDEFCDDWISTVAYITNPSIGVLIATLCTC
jgi:hypothetical protein